MTDDTLIARASLSLLDGQSHADAVDFPQFADAMASLTGTVCVVTSGTGETATGRTVTAITSLTATPPSLLISITKASALATAIETTGGFSVAMLSEAQTATGNAFAGEGPVEDRFTRDRWSAWPSGRPFLEGALANIDCRLAATVSLDTHCLFLGILIAATPTDTTPLLWHRRAYRALDGG